MTLSSSEAKAALLAFGEDLQQVSNDLYKAATRPLPQEKKQAALDAARRKLKAYEALLPTLSDSYRAEAIESFSRHIDAIKEDLPKVS